VSGFPGARRSVVGVHLNAVSDQGPIAERRFYPHCDPYAPRVAGVEGADVPPVVSRIRSRCGRHEGRVGIVGLRDDHVGGRFRGVGCVGVVDGVDEVFPRFHGIRRILFGNAQRGTAPHLRGFNRGGRLTRRIHLNTVQKLGAVWQRRVHLDRDGDVTRVAGSEGGDGPAIVGARIGSGRGGYEGDVGIVGLGDGHVVGIRYGRGVGIGDGVGEILAGCHRVRRIFFVDAQHRGRFEALDPDDAIRCPEGREEKVSRHRVDGRSFSAGESGDEVFSCSDDRVSVGVGVVGGNLVCSVLGNEDGGVGELRRSWRGVNESLGPACKRGFQAGTGQVVCSRTVGRVVNVIELPVRIAANLQLSCAADSRGHEG